MRRSRLFLALLALSQLITSVDYNIVYVALARIGAELGFDGHTLQWVVSAYAVAFGGFLLLGGRASDLLGRRRTFAAGLALYAVSSFAGGLATSAELLVAARAVQGLGGALLFPATLALIGSGFAEGRDRNRAYSVWAAAGGSGLILGSVLGGVLTEVFGWEAVFFVNVPLAGAALVAAFLLITPDGPRVADRPFDLPGSLTGTAGVTLLVLTLVQGPVAGWTSPPVAASGLAALALLAAFVVIESRSRDPLMPLRLFGHASLRTGTAVTTAFMATFGTALYFLTLYFQAVHGYSALQTGLAVLLPVVVGFAGSFVGGHILTRIGPRAALATFLNVGAAGALLLAAAISTDRGYLPLVPGLVLLSAGQGVVYTVMFAVASTGVPARDHGIASGLVSTGQQVGNAVGLAALVAIAGTGADGRTGEALRVSTSEGVRTALFAIAAAITLSIPLAFGFRRLPAADAAT